MKTGIKSLKLRIKYFWREIHASDFSAMIEAITSGALLFNMSFNPISRAMDVNLKHPSATFTDHCSFIPIFSVSLLHLPKSGSYFPQMPTVRI